MRPISVTIGAAGNTAWIPINELQNTFQVGGCVILSSGASLTYNLQHTFDDISGEKHSISISRTTTVATVTDTDHGLSVNDSVVIEQTGSTNLDGTQIVASVTNQNVYTYTVANTGAATDNGYAKALNARVFPHAILTAQTTRQDFNYAYNIQAIRLNISVYASGKATLISLQGVGR